MDPDEHRIYFAVGGSWVCPEHIADGYLRRWVESKADFDTCSFCDRQSDVPFAADLVAFTELVQQGVERGWSDLLDEGIPGMGYDSTLSSAEVVFEAGVTEDEVLAAAIGAALPERAWVHRNFLGLPPQHRLTLAWREFTELIKHRTRFFFPLQAKGEPRDPDEVTPLDLLRELAGAIMDAGLLTSWSPQDPIYRVRVHPAGEVVEHAWQLAAIPDDLAHLAAANRMSPAGISMFYGAGDTATAEAEARSVESEPEGKVATVGAFHALRPLRIVDLSKEIDVPSMFDPERAHLVPTLAFLAAFSRSLSESVTRDGREHVEYVPTQVVSEYLRSVHRFDGIDRIDGIAYPSTQRAGGTNLVLFIANDEVQNADGERPPRPDETRWLGPTWKHPAVILELRHHATSLL